MYKDIWVAGASNQLFIRGSYSEEKFSKKKKKKLLLAKLRCFWRVHFVPPILFISISASGRAVLYRNDAFLISVLSTKRRYSNFLKNVFILRKFVSKLKYWKRSKFPVVEKNADLSDGGLFWKSLAPFFRRTYALSIGYKQKGLR